MAEEVRRLPSVTEYRPSLSGRRLAAESETGLSRQACEHRAVRRLEPVLTSQYRIEYAGFGLIVRGI